MTGVRLTTCHLDDDRDIALTQARDSLSQDEATRAARFHFDRDRDRYVRARGFLRRSLATPLGTTPDRLVFTYSNTGKPGLADGPQFNLSHSADRAALAVSKAGPVGVDIEVLDRKSRMTDDLDGLMARCFGAEECRAITAAPDRLARFLEFWTAKEARMKLTGEGLGMDPQEIVLTLDTTGQAIGYQAPTTPAAHLERFSEDGIVGAIATPASL